ncbi:MAG: TolC family protein [Vicinamibacterales bacterium]
MAIAQPRAVTIGIAIDGPWERNDDVRAIFEREILALTRGEFDVRLPADKRLTADWTRQGAVRNVDSLLADPAVDLVLVAGPVGAAYVSRLGPLPKPTVATFVDDRDIQQLPLSDGASGVDNLVYVAFPTDFEQDLITFREIASFDRLTVLITKALHETLPGLAANVQAAAGRLGITTRIVDVDRTADDALARLGADTQAVYVMPLLQLAAGEFDRLAAGLVEKRLPSFSLWGTADVERGLYATTHPSTDFDRLGRRVALDVQRILLGENASTIPVFFRRNRRITINMATGRALGAYPPWRIVTEAEVLHDEGRESGRTVTLRSTMIEARAANLDLQAAGRTVDSGLQDVQRARSIFLPQIDVSAGGRIIDQDRAAASFGSVPQRLVSGSATLTQLLYSDGARANLEVQRHVQDARVATRARTTLDVSLDAAVAYLDVLRSKTFERIQRDNLRVTRSNLELAEVRAGIGSSGPAEVFRWQNQIAANRRDVIDASARRNQAEIALNRILNRALEEPFATQEADLDDPGLYTGARQLGPFVGNPWAFRIFRDFMVEEARGASPELGQIDATIAAQRRESLRARRAFWAPAVSLQADLTSFGRGGSGATPSLPQLPAGLLLPSANSLNWTLGVQASLPLFAGGARSADRAQADLDLARLQIEREAAADRVEQRVRSALHAAGASYASIELARDGAGAARQNLDLVVDAYSQGVVPIIDLLDAQNAALVADLVAANATFDYFIDLMNVERAIGRFDYFTDPTDAAAFRRRLEQYFRAAGYEVDAQSSDREGSRW